MKNHFIPTSIPNRILWLTNFSNKLPLYATKYNISAAQVTDTANGVLYLTWVNGYLVVAEPSIKKAQGFRRQLMDGIPEGEAAATAPAAIPLATAPTAVQPGILDRITAMAISIKGAINYSSADGIDMGIEGEEISEPAEEAMQPALRVFIGNGGQPEILWVKKNMDALKIYVDRGSGSFSFLATDTTPGYTDSFPLPAPGSSAVWKYRAIYIKDDHEIGLPSEISHITVTGSIL